MNTHYQVRGIVGGLRNAAALGVVSSVDDTGQAQTANLTTGDGVDRAEVEVAWPFGFSSVPPGDGMIGLVVALGADASNLMVMPIGNPSARFGGLQAGESVIYGGDGSRLHVRAGAVEIWATTIKLFGNVVVDGSIAATGNITAGEGGADQVDLQGHGHQVKNVQSGGATLTTTAPVAGT